jgi:hypothetical protein
VVRGQIEKEKEDEVEGRTLKERKVRKRERGINMENCGRIKREKETEKENIIK